MPSSPIFKNTICHDENIRNLLKIEGKNIISKDLDLCQV